MMRYGSIIFICSLYTVSALSLLAFGGNKLRSVSMMSDHVRIRGYNLLYTLWVNANCYDRPAWSISSDRI